MITIITGEKNPILRQKSKEVEHFTKEVYDLIEQMKRIIVKENALGLAAVQIGVPKRIIVCRVNDEFKIFINPEIKKYSKQTDVLEEGCLSLPNTYGEVERPKTIILQTKNEEGKKIKLKVFGLLSRVIQHEIDHLNGILFTDKAKNIRKENRGYSF
ncbi:MAG TPA: peptide deformylase [Candidatus Paceibacterota bacterium]|nr:peptide deformylase [Candidatus Paceibacterota bacterium]